MHRLNLLVDGSESHSLLSISRTGGYAWTKDLSARRVAVTVTEMEVEVEIQMKMEIEIGSGNESPHQPDDVHHADRKP